MQQGRMDSFVFCTKCKVFDNGALSKWVPLLA